LKEITIKREFPSNIKQFNVYYNIIAGIPVFETDTL
jgi:hypothetical protein